MDVLARNNVRTHGQGQIAMLFAHGFGCDQSMWRFVTPAFAADYKIVLFDHVGCGGSDLAAYDRERYGALAGYARDILQICDALSLSQVVFVGHSVSAMIGALAARMEPGRFSRLVMIGPSACYVNDGDYVGGFSRRDIEELLDALDDNYLGWSSKMAPAIMGDHPGHPEFAEELTNSFCRTDPEISRRFARVCFLSDNRADLPHVAVRSLVLQCSEDVIAPQVVGKYVHQNLRDSEFVLMKATGHCPNLSAPEETIRCMRSFLAA